MNLSDSDNQIIITLDGSHTVYSSLFKEHYHSLDGALNESQYIFIDLGLKTINSTEIFIFELGFGTGLNAMLTEKYARENKIKIHYHSIELYPIHLKIQNELNHKATAELDFVMYKKIMGCTWNQEVEINDHFVLRKINSDFTFWEFDQFYHLIYFDAFSPETQPELWSGQIFKKVWNCLLPLGILMTYSSKGIVKEALRNAGFFVKRLPGPGRKRHILRAIKQ